MKPDGGPADSLLSSPRGLRGRNLPRVFATLPPRLADRQGEARTLTGDLTCPACCHPFASCAARAPWRAASHLSWSPACRWGHSRRLSSGHSTSAFAIRRDRYVQRAVDVEVDIAAFVSKIARSAVLTRVEVHEGGQIRIHGVGPAVRYLGVHGGLCIEMRRRIHPNDIEVSGVL